MNLDTVCALARKHLNNNAAMESSARLCLADAMECANRGDVEGCHKRAIDSLRYSVGVFHTDFKRCAGKQ